MNAQIITELGFVYLLMSVMLKLYKKNQNALLKLGAILLVFNFTGFFILEDSILPIIIVTWLFYYLNKQGGLFND